MGISDSRDAVVGVDIVGVQAEEHRGDGRDAKVHRKVLFGQAPVHDPLDWDPADGLRSALSAAMCWSPRLPLRQPYLLVVPALVAHGCWLDWCEELRVVLSP